MNADDAADPTPRPPIELSSELRQAALGMIGLHSEMILNGMSRVDATYLIGTMMAKPGVILLPPIPNPGET
jgi:hypothetical protein